MVSVDEMTGIQALERKYSAKEVQPDSVEKREFEYIRHGTTSLRAFLEVSSRKIVHEYMNKTRTEADFEQAVRDMVMLDPKGNWVIVSDRLNTHQSESLVKLVAEHEELSEELGVKGKEGILKNMKSRVAFLSDSSHKIRFIYTPRHASWINQIEIWFSILAKKLLKRMSYTSTVELKASIGRFIEQYNITAHPFTWTYKGEPASE